MIALDRCPARQTDFVARRIGHETILVPIRGGVGELDFIFTLNEIGTRIWELSDGATPVRRILEVIRAEYEVSAEQAEGDVEEFLIRLEQSGLMKPAGKDPD